MAEKDKKSEEKPMDDIPKEDQKEKKENEDKKEEKPKLTNYQEFRQFLNLYEGSISKKEMKGVATQTKRLGEFRKGFTLEEARIICNLLLQMPLPSGNFDSSKFLFSQKEIAKYSAIIEIATFIKLLLITKLIDNKIKIEAEEMATALIKQISNINRRTLDQLNSRAYFYYAWASELNGNLSNIRIELFAAHRSACLRLDQITQATVLNILLRSYLSKNEYEQGRNLVSKSTFPESISNNQLARYLYYNGRIRAVQLEYSESQLRLIQALRKCPQTSAKGFRMQAQKLLVVVELLMGDIPERNIFSQKAYRHCLIPYYNIVQSVRAGDLKAFGETLDTYEGVFRRDKNYSLIHRIRHNVIKFGLRNIYLSYSRISLIDICGKLHLDGVTETEYTVAKAIRDGVIDATINHEEQYVQTKQLADVYTSHEPQIALHKRIKFCLDLNNEAVKALEFPPKEIKDQDIPDIEKDDHDELIVEDMGEPGIGGSDF